MTVALSLANSGHPSEETEAGGSGTHAPRTTARDRRDPFRPQELPVLPSRLPLDPQRSAARPETGAPSNEDADAESVWIVPRTRRSQVRFRLLQQWEGTVTDVNGEGFVAHLRDTRDPDGPLEKASIAFDELADHDIPLVEPGAIFDWTIGYLTHPHGQKTTESTIVFRRMPRWSARDIERMKRAAADFDGLFDAPR